MLFPLLKTIKLFRLEKTSKISSPHTVFCVFLGNERMLFLFFNFFPVRNVFNFFILCPNPGKEAAWKILPCYQAFYTHPTPKGTQIIVTWLIKIWVSQFCTFSFQGSWNTFSCPFRLILQCVCRWGFVQGCLAVSLLPTRWHSKPSVLQSFPQDGLWEGESPTSSLHRSLHVV